MKIGIIVQCRYNSTRLKGKILKKILNKTILEILIERLNEVKRADNICLAIANHKNDSKIINLVKKIGINYHIGSELNVLKRYYDCAKKNKFNTIMRITSDCPLIDPIILDKLIYSYVKSNVDYMSNGLIRTFPLGMEAEIFSFKTLEKAYKNSKNDYDKEHVTTYIKSNKNFSKKNIKSNKNLSKYRFTLDTIEDYELITQIYLKLYPQKKIFYLSDIISLMKSNNNLFDINKNVIQKS